MSVKHLTPDKRGEAQRRSLHVVHSCLSLEIGGLERVVADLVRLGIERGNRVAVVCLEREGMLAAEVRNAGGEVFCLHKPPGLQKPTYAAASRVLEDLKADVLHTHQIGPLWYLGPAARQLRVPAVVHTEHTDNVRMTRTLLRKVKMRVLWHRAAKFASFFCCVSNDIAKSATRWGTVPRAKARVVLNGIDTERYSKRDGRSAVRRQFNIPDDAYVLGTVGRLNEVKRQDLLLRATAELLPQRENLHLLLVGDGPARAELEQLAGELGIRGRVTFAGFQSSPEKFLAAMDTFALTSRLEGLPLAMLEAWATKLPVVASAVGGIPSVVVDGQNGVLFPSGDLAQLTTALYRVQADPALASKLAEAGQATVQRDYSLARMSMEYENIYHELLAGKTRGTTPNVDRQGMPA